MPYHSEIEVHDVQGDPEARSGMDTDEGPQGETGPPGQPGEGLIVTTPPGVPPAEVVSFSPSRVREAFKLTDAKGDPIERLRG